MTYITFRAADVKVQRAMAPIKCDRLHCSSDDWGNKCNNRTVINNHGCALMKKSKEGKNQRRD